MAEQVNAVYSYVHPETGEIMAEKIRYEPKSFQWTTVTGGKVDEKTLPLYNAVKLNKYPADKVVLFVEGEKSADALEKLGVLAVCLPGGAAAKPTMEQLKVLRGRRVAIWPDKDQPGRLLMRRVLDKLRPIALELYVIYPDSVPPKGDAFDWIQQGGSKNELAEELKKNPRHVLAEKQLNIIDLDTIEPKDIEWLWPGYLPLGMLVMLEGQKGVGKSWLTLQLAAMVSKGDIDVAGTPMGQKGNGKVMLLCHEDPVDEVVVPRLKAMGANLSNIKILSSTIDNESGEETWFDLHDDIEALEDALCADDYRLLIIDPINNYINAGLDTYKDSHVRQVLSPLAAMAQRAGVCVIGIRHFKKAREGSMLDWGVGSIAYGAVARTVHAVIKDPISNDEEVLMFPVATNLTLKPYPVAFKIVDQGMSARFEWLGRRDYTEEMLRAEMGKKKDKGDNWHEDKLDQLQRILSDNQEHLFRDVQGTLGVSALTLVDYLYRSNYSEDEVDINGIIPKINFDKAKDRGEKGI